MPKYLVAWSIEVDAPDPESAAHTARRQQLVRDGTTEFDVVPFDNGEPDFDKSVTMEVEVTTHFVIPNNSMLPN